MVENPPIAHEPHAMYEHIDTWGEHPVGVSVSGAIRAEIPIMSDSDFMREIAQNEELERQASRVQEAGNVMGIIRGGPGQIKSYIARELHHITDSKMTKVVAVGAGAVTVFLVQHELRKHIVPAIRRYRSGLRKDDEAEVIEPKEHR